MEDLSPANREEEWVYELGRYLSDWTLMGDTDECELLFGITFDRGK